MKLSIEVQMLTRPPAGIYRYAINLLQHLSSQTPAVTLAPFVFSDEWLEPYDPGVFQEIFRQGIIGKYHASGRCDEEVVQHGPPWCNRAHQCAKNRFAEENRCGRRSACPAWLKLRREWFRCLVRLQLSFRAWQAKAGRNLLFDPHSDLVHSLYLPFPPEVFARKRRPKLCQTVHDIIPIIDDSLSADPGSGSFHPFIESARGVDVVLVPSESTKRDLLSLGGFDEGRIVVTPLAVDAKFFPATVDEIGAVRARHGIAAGEDYFLSVSTLEPRKNFPFLLRCFRDLIAMPGGKSCKLVITGRVGWGDAVNHEIRSLLDALRDHVVYPGFVDDDSLRALYSGASAFLMPSLYEGFGLPVLEAMACGTPVIASDTSSLPEVLGDAGVKVAPSDRDGWIDAMRSILAASDSEAGHRSQQSLRRASCFSWEATARQTMRAYKDVGRKVS